MSVQITQSQRNTTKQTLRGLKLKIDVLDFDYMIVDSIEGNVLSGNIRIDANSDIRRTCNIELIVTGSTFDIQAGSDIWLDKYIKIQVGIDDQKTGETAWTNMGIFLINQPSYTYDATTYTLSFDGLDLMAKMTGQRNGYITGLAGEDIALVETGQNVRDAIIGVLEQNGFTEYVVEECRLANGVIQDVPYDMEFEQGSTWYEMLYELSNIVPSYQIYFDADGVFHYNQIPFTDDEPIMIDEDIWHENTISEHLSVNFEDIFNAVEVYGVTHDIVYYSDETVSTISENIVNLTVAEQFPLEEFVEIGFTLPEDAIGDILINLNGTGEIPLLNPDGTRVTKLDAHTYWVIVYQADNTWQFYGHLQAQGYWEDNNPDSPFYVNGSMGKILLPLYGREYENIQNDDLAIQRAKYEIYLRCRLNDVLQLTTVPIYWADVNWKVRYKPLGGTIPREYFVKSIQINLTEQGNQTWELSHFYPLYPVI